MCCDREVRVTLLGCGRVLCCFGLEMVPGVMSVGTCDSFTHSPSQPYLFLTRCTSTFIFQTIPHPHTRHTPPRPPTGPYFQLAYQHVEGFQKEMFPPSLLHLNFFAHALGLKNLNFKTLTRILKVMVVTMLDRNDWIFQR